MLRAGLDGVLDSEDVNLTVFSPNDDAFAKLSASIVNTLLTNDAFLPHLTDLLLYHVLGTQITTNMYAFSNGTFLDALNDESLAITRPPLLINDSKILVRNIDASNGVANVIDSVLLPSWVSNSITDRVVGDSDLSTLLALVVRADLSDTFAGPGEITLVAPTNDAFAKSPVRAFRFLLTDPGKSLLVKLLLYHVFPDIIVSSELSDGLNVKTLHGDTVAVSFGEDDVFLNAAKVIQVDILANNGVVHKIDTVLFPPPLETRTKRNH
jgi:transforming growth factor-beta-induced protein